MWGGGKYLSFVHEAKIRGLLNAGYLPAQAEIIELSKMDDNEFSFYMDLFVEQIKSRYCIDQIILVDCQAVPFSLSKKQDNINFFDNSIIRKWHININRGYRYLRRKLEGCHVIEFPKGVIGDEGHKWGRASLHYVPEYYNYGLEAVDIITQERLSFKEEQKKLRELKEKYEDMLKLKYEPMMVRTFLHLKERESICTRMTAYEKFMKDLLLHEGKVLWVRNFMRENQFEHCAFYGLSELAKFYLKMFRRWMIQVDYVVENIKEETFEGVKCIARTEQDYPKTQIMIIMDVVTPDKIKERLEKLKVPYPVYDIYEVSQ